MKNVLIIARSFPPFLPIGHSIRVIKFIKYLPALGWNSIVLTVDDLKEYETLPKMGSESSLSEIDANTKIYRTGTGEPSVNYLRREDEFGHKNVLTRIIVKLFGGARRWIFRNLLLPDRTMTWFPFAVKEGVKIVNDENIDVIFATCPPHSALIIGAALKLLTRKPLVLDYRDDWIDTPWYMAKPAISRRVEKLLENQVVLIADKVILVTEWSMKAFQERYPKQPIEKFNLIPNGCDLADFNVLRNEEPTPHNMRFSILHAGSLNKSAVWGRSLEGFFRAVQKLLLENPALNNKLVINFAGDYPNEYRKRADEMGISSVIQGLGHIPHDEVLRLTKSSKLLLALNYDGWATLIPGKIYEYWAVGGPPILLLSCPGAATDFIHEHNIGFSADPSDVAGIKAAILSAYRLSISASPLRVSTIGIESYDRKELTKKLAQVLEML